MRLFLAIALTPIARETISREQEALRARLAGLKLKWVSSQNLHVTLVFFGEVEESRLTELKRTLGLAARELSPMEVEYQGFGGFPFRRPRILWTGATSGVGTHLSEAMCHLMRACSEFVKPDEREPFPHVTVARVSGKQTGDASRAIESALLSFQWGDPVTQQVTELTLYQSHLTKEGSMYEVVEVFPLGDHRL